PHTTTRLSRPKYSRGPWAAQAIRGSCLSFAERRSRKRRHHWASVPGHWASPYFSPRRSASGGMIARAPRPAHLAELPALGQGGEMGLDPAGGDGGHVGDPLAGESREAAHAVEDGTGDVGGLGRLAGEPFPRARAGAGARLRARTAPPADRGGACPRMLGRERSRLREPCLPVPQQVPVQVLHPVIVQRL